MGLKEQSNELRDKLFHLEDLMTDLKNEFSQLEHEVNKQREKEIVIEYGAVYDWKNITDDSHQYVLARSGNEGWTFTNIFGFNYIRDELKFMTKDEITTLVTKYVRRGSIKFVGMAKDIITVDIPE